MKDGGESGGGGDGGGGLAPAVLSGSAVMAATLFAEQLGVLDAPM